MGAPGHCRTRPTADDDDDYHSERYVEDVFPYDLVASESNSPVSYMDALTIFNRYAGFYRLPIVSPATLSRQLMEGFAYNLDK